MITSKNTKNGDIMKITYEIQYNSTTKTWNIFKYIEDDHSFNFYSVFESTSRKECKEYLDRNLKEGKSKGGRKKEKNTKAFKI